MSQLLVIPKLGIL